MIPDVPVRQYVLSVPFELRLLLASPATWVYYLLYAWVGVFGILTTSQFWLLAGEILDAAQARRIFLANGSNCMGHGPGCGGESAGLRCFQSKQACRDQTVDQRVTSNPEK